MARTLNPTDVATKWATNLVNARPSIEAGVKAVTESPMQKAADSTDAYVAGVQRAVESGKFQRGLARVSLNDWKTAMVNKGLNRLQNGVTEAKPKMQNFLTQFLPFVQQVSQTVQAMPKATDMDKENRMLANVRLMRQFAKS